MIARVKIAPVEQWCEAAKKDGLNRYPGGVRCVGQPAEIETLSLNTYRGKSSCGGRLWALTPRSARHLTELSGAAEWFDETFVCEHMLEMD
jgi:hypothetical protein